MATLLSQRIARIVNVLLVLHASNSWAESGDTAPSVVERSAAAQIEAVDAMLSRHLKPGAPGVTVIVTRDGSLLFRKAYGLANVEKNIALKPEMALRVGSVTKQFTAAAIMLLTEQGKLAISDEIGKYLPDFQSRGHSVTIENLLTHTSGIANYTALPKFPSVMKMGATVGEAISFFKEATPEFTPGERFSYSNSNYFLLGAIIEIVSGMPYADFMEQHIFRPLQLVNTKIETDALLDAPVVGYTQARRKVVSAPYYSMSWPYAAGALRTTVDDLALWDRAITEGKLLKPEFWQRMTTSYKLNATGIATGYGYGWFIRKVRHRKVIEHGGDIGGFSADAMRFPREGLFIAVLANSDSLDPAPDALAEKIAALFLPH